MPPHQSEARCPVANLPSSRPSVTTAFAWLAALNLRVAALKESPEAFGSTVVRERGLPLETWQARLTCNAWFAAFDAEIAVGLACGVHTETPDERELTGLWVAPSHRGTGLGDALVTSVRDWAALQGAHRLTLEVVRINESAIDLYMRHGFEVVGQTETSPSPDRNAHPSRP